MAEVSAKQLPADDVMLVGDQALRSELLDAEQTKKIRDGMYGLNGRWNTLNIDVIEKEMRLVNWNLNDHVITGSLISIGILVVGFRGWGIGVSMCCLYQIRESRAEQREQSGVE